MPTVKESSSIASHEKSPNAEAPSSTLHNDHDDYNRSEEEMGSANRRYLSYTGTLAWTALIVCAISAPSLFAFDLVVVANLQAKIVADLGEIEKLSWISVSYTLAGMSSVLLWGRLFAEYNIKWTFITSALIFVAGCGLSGGAPTMNVLIGGRALSGVGAVGLFQGSMNVIAAVTSIKQRPLYIALNSIAYGVSTVVAPVAGGLLADARPGWRWGFYIIVIASASFFPGYVLLFPSVSFASDNSKTESWRKHLGRLDIVGISLWACAAVTLLMAISFGGVMYQWGSGRIVGLFTSSGILWILFAVQQWTGLAVSGEHKIFPIRFLHSIEMMILFGQIFLSTTTAFVPLYLVPLYFQFVRGQSAIIAGLHIVPLVALRSFLSLASAVIMKKSGHVMPLFLVGAAFALAGTAPFLVVSETTSVAAIYGFTVLIGTGTGMYNQAPYVVAQARNSPDDVAQAITFITSGQFLGFALPLAISNSIFVNRAFDQIEKLLPDLTSDALQDLITGDHRHDPRSAQLQLDQQQQNTVLQALSDALSDAWAVVVAAAALSVLLAVLMKREKLW